MSEDYQKAIEFISDYLYKVRDKLDNATIEGVEHYLDHGEYEMAFEMLILGVIEANAVLPEFNEAKLIALELDLHEDSVFDFDFWSKFSRFYDDLSN